MICENIKYDNFRCLKNVSLEFSPEINIFEGNNAQGKTSALEGLFLFARGKSFKTNHDSEMIGFGNETASVEMTMKNNIKSYQMKISYYGEKKRLCKRNDIDIKKLSEFVGYFRAVMFWPQHLSIVKEGPGVRRNFLDTAISQIKPSYLAALQKYNNLLIQRNALIKNNVNNKKQITDTIEFWSIQMSEIGEKISDERNKYVEKLTYYTNMFLNDMTNKSESCDLKYRDYKTKEEYLKELTVNLERECRAGITLYGPHKDDLEIILNGFNAKTFASQGQQRSIALAMKLAESEISKEITGETPVLALDDVLSELDSKRREYIINGITGRQVFITTCDKLNFESLSKAKHFHVEKGNIY